MGRSLGFVAVLGLLLMSCNVDATPRTSSPAATADIRRSRIDITYSDLMENDVHKAEATKTGGTDDFPALEFQDTNQAVLSDFAKFADAAAAFAARNRQMT